MTKLTDAQLSAVCAEMRGILVACAQAGHTIAYSELTRELQSTRLHYRAPLLSRLLALVNDREEAQGRPGLAALVVNKQMGWPGAGYFTLTDVVGMSDAQMIAYWQKDVEAAYAYWRDRTDDAEQGA
jgi:hypothetical protein